MTDASVDIGVSAADVFTALDATWPPAEQHETASWQIGEGQGGGKRVSSARMRHPYEGLDAIREMERFHGVLGQQHLVMLRPGETTLDAALEARGYGLVDPTVALAARLSQFPVDLAPVTAFEVAWPPLALQTEIWARGGIGPSRIEVMARVAGRHVTILGRIGDKPAATTFVACHERIAMVHALEVLPEHRRSGLGRSLMAAAARWSMQQGAEVLAVLVTRANAPAVALYRGLGLREVTSYHYRMGGGPDATTVTGMANQQGS